MRKVLTLPVFLAQMSIWEMVKDAKPIPMAVMALLALISVFSWTLIFAKWSSFRNASEWNRRFLRAFRKSQGMEAVAVASEQFKSSPLMAVFDFGYEEVERQVKRRGTISNKLAIERALQLGISEELAILERSMNLLATVAAISPFIGLFGTVWGIIDAFSALGLAGSASLRAVAPGISEALIATALGLFAAIPAAVAYNIFGQTLKEQNARMEDFALEFMNLAERQFED
jgi:biopolymer transport protein TolQ